MKPLVSLSAEHLNVSQQHGRLVSISQPCPGVSLHQFLHSARGMPRCLWESPQDGFAFAGIGAALELMAWGPERFETVQERAEAMLSHALILETGEPLAAPLLFGGFSFRDDFVPDLAWSDFTPAHFILPHYQLVQGHAGPWLTLNAHVPFDEDPHALAAELHTALSSKIAELQAAPERNIARTQSGHLTYPMSFNAWERA
jgi:menaquinone-specific isochorismate synthase